MNWQRSHSRENANCIVSIWDEAKKQWVSKEDTGTESYTEKEKGLASDSFKRACFNWGIGRELYTAPSIHIPPDNCKIVAKGAGYACYDKFYVSEIGYDDRRNISKLKIRNTAPSIHIPPDNCKIVAKGAGYACYDKFYVSEIGYDDRRNISKLKIRNYNTKSIVFAYEFNRASKEQIDRINFICKKHRVDLEELYSSNKLSEDSLTAEQAGQLLKSLENKFGDD